MSLREQKKRRIRAAIIENAIALFRERGFDATRVQDIARPLELSDATFFNYFPTKDAVLTEWVRDLVDAAFAEATEARSGQARVAGRAAAHCLAEQIHPDLEFWSELWPRVRQSAGRASPRVRQLVADAQARGELRGDLPASQLADLLVAGLLAALGGWLAEATQSAGRAGRAGRAERAERSGALATRLQAAVDLVLDGSRKRNERVRPPAGPTPGRGASAESG